MSSQYKPSQDKDLIAKVNISGLVFIISLVLMFLVQLPTPDYLNPAGCLFALIWMASGIFFGMGALTIWLD